LYDISILIDKQESLYNVLIVSYNGNNCRVKNIFTNTKKEVSMPKKSLTPSKRKGVPAKSEEYNPFALLRQEVNALFDNFPRGSEIEPFTGRFGVFSPSVDIKESDKDIKVSAELPGMEEKDIEVSLGRDSLTIKGEKKEEKEDKGKNYYRMERSYGSFTRTIPLPAEVDMDKVKAEFKKGILTVTLPKTARAIKETKKIPVKAE
jgi:HSP20 family protein